MIGVDTQLIKTDVVEAEIGRRRMQPAEGAVTEYCSSHEVLNMPCAPPSVSAVRVTRLTTSPRMYLAR